MRNSSRLIGILLVLTSSRVQAQDPSAPPSQAPEVAAEEVLSYQSKVWASLAPVSSGFTAALAAESARKSSPSVGLAEAEVEASLARTQQTLSRYVPNLVVQGSVTRRNAIEYDFGTAGASVGALNEGLLTVGTCPGSANSCVLDAQGQPVGAVATQAFVIPRNTYSVDATLSVPFSDYALALIPARKGARADERAARLRKDAEVETVEVNARIAYYDWLRAKAQLAVATESLTSFDDRLRDARLGVEAGTVTTADALGIESLAASSQVSLANAQSFLRLAEQNLRVTAQYSGALSIGEDLTVEPADIRSLGELQVLIEHGKAHRAEIRALGKAADASRYASESVGANKYPRLDGIANVTHANPNQGFFPPTAEWNTSWLVGLNLTWRLDGFLNTRAQVRELDANVRVLEAQRSALERAIELEVRSAWEDYMRAAAAARMSESELRAAEAMHEQRVVLFLGGEATSTDVVEAEIQRANATFRKITASIDKRIALARMRRAAAVQGPRAESPNR